MKALLVIFLIIFPCILYAQEDIDMEDLPGFNFQNKRQAPDGMMIYTYTPVDFEDFFLTVAITKSSFHDYETGTFTLDHTIQTIDGIEIEYAFNIGIDIVDPPKRTLAFDFMLSDTLFAGEISHTHQSRPDELLQILGTFITALAKPESPIVIQSESLVETQTETRTETQTETKSETEGVLTVIANEYYMDILGIWTNGKYLILDTVLYNDTSKEACFYAVDFRAYFYGDEYIPQNMDDIRDKDYPNRDYPGGYNGQCLAPGTRQPSFLSYKINPEISDFRFRFTPYDAQSSLTIWLDRQADNTYHYGIIEIQRGDALSTTSWPEPDYISRDLSDEEKQLFDMIKKTMADDGLEVTDVYWDDSTLVFTAPSSSVLFDDDMEYMAKYSSSITGCVIGAFSTYDVTPPEQVYVNFKHYNNTQYRFILKYADALAFVNDEIDKEELTSRILLVENPDD